MVRECTHCICFQYSSLWDMAVETLEWIQLSQPLKSIVQYNYIPQISWVNIEQLISFNSYTKDEHNFKHKSLMSIDYTVPEFT